MRSLDHIEREGERFLEQVTAIGLEGIIAKKAVASYRSGRSPKWLKIKAVRTGDFVIVGFTDPKGSRTRLGALQLADVVNGALVYAGRVGTGFNDALLSEIGALLGESVLEEAPCAGPVIAPGAEPRSTAEILETSTTTWVRPLHVCEVRYAEFTPDGVLRHAVFVRLRADKRPDECERQGWSVLVEPEAAIPPVDVQDRRADPPPPPPQAAVQKTVNISTPKKLYWPADGYTKGDLLEYYRAASPWILPYLRNRPVVLTRFPDGIDGKSFYQKDAPDFVPEWIRTIPIWSEETQRDIRYFVCDDEETLRYIANMGSIPLHIWASRVGSLELCDWCVLDLDPKDAPFRDVIRTAVALRALCDAIGLPSFVKTTGKTGLHILLPLGRQCTYEQSRVLGELLARFVLRDLQSIATITRHVQKRGDKVYIDYLQNRHGQTIVAPFSVRPLPGATVSMPLIWDEVNDSLDPRAFTIRTALDRMERLGADPVAGVLDTKPDLGDVLDRLGALMAG